MSDLRWDEVLDAFPDAVVVLDTDSRIVFGNAAARSLFDRPGEDLIGRPAADFVSDRDREFVAEMRRARLDTGVAPEGPQQIEVMRPDGSLVPVEVRVGVAGGAEDESLVICALRDVSGRLRDEESRRRLEAALNEAKRLEAVGQLAGGVAHDFNNLLAIVLNYSSFVAQELPESSPQQEDLAEIRKAGERGAALTRQLLIFSRRELTRPEVIDLNATIAGLEKLLRRTLGEHVELTVVAGEELWPVSADPAQIEQMIVELAINARDAMPSGGALTISTDNAELDESYAEGHPDVLPGPYVRVTVSDTGSGIERDRLDRIFEPYYTGRAEGPERPGLGLAAVHGIVVQAHGHIAVYSEVGVGSVFKLYLPAAIGARPAPLEPEAPERTGTVLVVEDEPAVLRLAARVLERGGHSVRLAGDGAEALELIEADAEGIDVVLTDVVMPRLSGPQLAQELGRSRPELPVVFMSGYPEQMVSRDQGLEPGVTLVEKPFTARALLDAVGRALADQPA
jgi:PAS domain S-box-containing protein